MRKLTTTKALTTGMPVDKVRRLADAAGVSLSHVETRFAGKGKWLNDFEISGPPGKVDKFFEKVDDIRVD
ncbi:hypothetical protein [Anaeroselena agilis]|uniref:Uncharacterized protein n=1 Tax=Anaeroselena agilis TaxID=3063788 RepID=A0ABU3NZ48_9FIRM|nr:hypothetical protein [Selenomonadales bacterium 4137-cl]